VEEQQPVSQNLPKSVPANPKSLDSVTPPQRPDNIEQQAGRLFSTLQAEISHTKSFSGPLPTPEYLADYEKACPGAAERILAMAERQSLHRQTMESAVITSDSRRADLGVVSALVLCFTSIVGGVVAISLGHDAPGSLISTTGVIGLAGTFIYGTISRKNERKEKALIIAGQAPPPEVPGSNPPMPPN
jgi:uncharacterized membrane protein